jgi:hypothetical protein
MTISSINTTTYYSTSTLSESRTLPPPPPPEGAPPAGGLAEDVFAALEELGLLDTQSETGTDTTAAGEAMGQFMFTLFEAMRMQGADAVYGGDPLADMDSLISALDGESAGFGELSASYENLVSTLGSSSADAASLQEFLETLRSQMSERGFSGLPGSVLETTA